MPDKRYSSNVSLEGGLVEAFNKMPISYDQIVSSPVFTFFVGKQHKPMTIHTALVAEQSPVLRTLVSGSMEEAHSGRATWEDVDEDTFARFAQFVYTGDYSPAAHEECGLDTDAPSEPEHEVNEDPVITTDAIVIIDEESYEPPAVEEHSWARWDSPKRQTKIEKRASKPKRPLRTKFHDRIYHVPASLAFMERRCEARANTSDCEDYTPVFLGHARLYAFAEKYDMEPLKAVVLNKLHKTLCLFTPYKARRDDVLELLRFTYETTPPRPRIDPLRELITQYITYEAKHFISTENCLSLVEEGGQLARDLFAMLLEKVTNCEGS